MKQNWQKKEKGDAKDFGAKMTPRSGGLWGNKGDMRDEHFNYDSKQTKHASYSISSSTWQKVYKEALRHNRMPVLSVQLGTGEEFVVLSKADFIYIKEQFEIYEDLRNS